MTYTCCFTLSNLADFEGTAASLGKPALADLQQGLATAPVLFAAQQFPNLVPLIERKFSTPGDVSVAINCVTNANGLLLTRRLAIAHGQLALNSLSELHPSPAKTALAALVSRVLNRTR
jgi:hexaprenyl-diphosphate synthase